MVPYVRNQRCGDAMQETRRAIEAEVCNKGPVEHRPPTFVLINVAMAHNEG